MSTGIKERLESLANPMLVRQMHQSLHSRKFLGAVWLMLLASLLTYAVVFMATESGSPSGGAMFIAFALVFFLAALVVLPYMAFSSLREEIQSRTIELIQITCMGARRQVRGRLQAALSRLLLLYSVIGPFAVVAFLFGGIGLETILLTLYTLLILSCLAVSLAIFFAALTSVKYLAHLARWLYFVVLIVTLIAGSQALLGAVGSMAFGTGMGGGKATLLYAAVLGVEGALLSWFLCAAAANMLTFEANKGSGRTRFIFLLIILSGLAFCALMLATGWSDAGPWITLEICTALALAACAMIWLTGSPGMPTSVRRKLAGAGFLYRLVRFPFVDGPGPTISYLILAAALVAGGLVAALSSGVRYVDQVMFVPLILTVAYAPYFSSCTWGIARILPAPWRNSGARRVVLLGIVICHAFVSILWFAAHLGSGGAFDIGVRNAFAALFPILYLPYALEDSLGPMDLLPGLSLVLLVGLVPHLVICVLSLHRHLSGEYH